MMMKGFILGYSFFLASLAAAAFASTLKLQETDLNVNINDVQVLNGSWKMQLKVPYTAFDGTKQSHLFNVTNDDNSDKSAEWAPVSGSETNSTKVTIPLKSDEGQTFLMTLTIVDEKKLFFIKDINISYTLMDNIPGVNVSEAQNETLIQSNNRPKFQTPLAHYFRCDTSLPLQFSDNSEVKISETKFQAFVINDWNSAEIELCPRDYETRADIRIATGSAFAGLILIAIFTIVIMKVCNCGAGSD